MRIILSFSKMRQNNSLHFYLCIFSQTIHLDEIQIDMAEVLSQSL